MTSKDLNDLLQTMQNNGVMSCRVKTIDYELEVVLAPTVNQDISTNNGPGGWKRTPEVQPQELDNIEYLNQKIEEIHKMESVE